MHDLLFAHPREWSNNKANETFIRFAGQIEIDVDAFTACLEEGRFLEQIRADFDYGVSKGVTSTPSFFVNDQPLVGAQPLNVFNEAIATVMEGGELASTQPEAAPEPTRVVVADEGIAAILGSDDAPFTIVEFTNYGCENCAIHAADAFPKVAEFLIDPGRIQYILKDLPGDAASPEVQMAAIAARCAGGQDAYWEMHQSLFSNQAQWLGVNDADDVFVDLAVDLSLDGDVFSNCLRSNDYEADLQANRSEAAELAITAYPHFIIEGQQFDGSEPNALAIALGLPMDVPVDNGAFTFGDPNAPITIVEYTDYQCPFCTQHFEQTLPALMENFVDTGKVYYVVKDFPLTSIHPQAVMAAVAARCANEQDAFAQMHDALFARQSEWSNNANAADVFTGYATEFGLDTDLFTVCLQSSEMETAVLDNMNEGRGFGVNGTPAFFINGTLVSGALPYESFAQGLNGLLEAGE